jgi:hypothetical protein
MLFLVMSKGLTQFITAVAPGLCTKLIQSRMRQLQAPPLVSSGCDNSTYGSALSVVYRP